MDGHAGGRKLGKHLRQEFLRDCLIHQQRLCRVAHAYALRLGVYHDATSHIELSGFVHIDMAVARARLDDRHK